MSKTFRLIAPDWQAGAKEDYYFGSQMLSMLAPKSDNQIERTVSVAAPTGAELREENGVVEQSATFANVTNAKKIIADEQPDRIITLGGNCLVSQAPFDYLHGKYGNKLCVIWFDAHPDVSSPKMFNHEHAMVLANLLQQGDPALHCLTDHPFQPQDILYMGLQPLTEEEVPQMEKLGLSYVIQKESMLSREDILAWMQKGGYTKIALHWDLDVISPTDYHSLYFNEPDVPMFAGSSCGHFKFVEIVNKLLEIQDMADIVGFTIAEYLPWDAIRLRKALSQMSIFQA